MEDRGVTERKIRKTVGRVWRRSKVESEEEL